MAPIKPREADILAQAVPHNVEFWRSQPDVEKVEVLQLGSDADGPKIGLSIWLRAGAEDEPFDPPDMGAEPNCEEDLYLGAKDICEGEWFWERIQGLEHYSFLQDFGPEWWGVKIWLKDPSVLKPVD